MLNKRSLLASLLLLGSFAHVFAQTNLPNTAGGSSMISGQLHEFNIGEMVLVQTFTIGNPAQKTFLSQGFLQPNYTPVSINNFATDVVIVNNIISPNNDGVNDYLFIEGLGNHLGSKLNIYDKAGRKLYSATDYQNDWNGTFNGKKLNEDTYFYIIDLGPNFSVIKGTVSIVLD